MADELLKALGQLQRAQQTGRTRDGPGLAPEFGPLDADEQASILDAVFGPATGASAAATATATATSTSTEAPAPAPPGASGADVVPIARARARRGWLAGVSSLAAAAALFVVLRSGDGGDAPGVPDYAITRAGGEVLSRGTEPAADTTVRLRGDTAIDWIVTPAEPVRGPIDLRVVATKGEERRWVAVDAVRSISADGVIRLRGRAGAWLDLTPGTWTLTLVIARPERLPSDLDAFVHGADRPAERGWQLEQMQVQIEG
jgi:hypothetical protein